MFEEGFVSSRARTLQHLAQLALYKQFSEYWLLFLLDLLQSRKGLCSGDIDRRKKGGRKQVY